MTFENRKDAIAYFRRKGYEIIGIYRKGGAIMENLITKEKIVVAPDGVVSPC